MAHWNTTYFSLQHRLAWEKKKNCSKIIFFLCVKWLLLIAIVFVIVVELLGCCGKSAKCCLHRCAGQRRLLFCFYLLRFFFAYSIDQLDRVSRASHPSSQPSNFPLLYDTALFFSWVFFIISWLWCLFSFFVFVCFFSLHFIWLDATNMNEGESAGERPSIGFAPAVVNRRSIPNPSSSLVNPVRIYAQFILNPNILHTYTHKIDETVAWSETPSSFYTHTHTNTNTPFTTRHRAPLWIVVFRVFDVDSIACLCPSLHHFQSRAAVHRFLRAVFL